MLLTFKKLTYIGVIIMITILTDVMENFIELMEKAAVEFEIFNN